MYLLILGLAVWSGAHFFKRLFPEFRAKLGEPGKGLVSLLLLGSIVLMVLGYRLADGPVFWERNSALVGLNNLLMLVSIYLFAASGTKAAVTRRIRHPQLAAVKLWSLAHVLVNGDLASLVLFSGLLAWAVAQMIMINKAERGPWRPDPSENKGEMRTFVITLVMTALIMGAHAWLGYIPWM